MYRLTAVKINDDGSVSVHTSRTLFPSLADIYAELGYLVAIEYE